MQILNMAFISLGSFLDLIPSVQHMRSTIKVPKGLSVKTFKRTTFDPAGEHSLWERDACADEKVKKVKCHRRQKGKGHG